MSQKLIKILLGLCGFFVCGLLFFSLYDVFFLDAVWSVVVFVLYGFSGVVVCYLMVALHRYAGLEVDLVEEFQKQLQGGLVYFVCSRCHGVFAVKFSCLVSSKQPRFNCPSCGRRGLCIGGVQGDTSFFSVETVSARFTCRECGESLSVWLFGGKEMRNASKSACPYCGENDSMYAC